MDQIAFGIKLFHLIIFIQDNLQERIRGLVEVHT